MEEVTGSGGLVAAPPVTVEVEARRRLHPQPPLSPAPQADGSRPSAADVVRSITVFLLVGMVGVALLFGGLIWDAITHANDPELEHVESGIFAVSNPAHLLLLLGGGLAVASITTALVRALPLSTGRRLASRRTGAVLVVSTLSMAAVTGGALYWSSRAEPAIATGPLAPAPGPDNHRLGVVNSHAPGPCRPTKAQKAAAQKLVDDTKAGTARYASLANALADGYAGPPVPGPTEHYPSGSAVLDGKVLDPTRPESLIYTTTSRGPVLVGVMYMMNYPGEFGPEPGGCLTRWHVHTNVCFWTSTWELAYELREGETACPEATFRYTPPPALHVWLVDVPGGRFALEADHEQLIRVVGP